MKTKAFKILILSVVLTACNDSLELNNPLNRHLDQEIENRITVLSKENKVDEKLNRDLPVYFSGIDHKIKEMTASINLFDASLQTAKQADEFFEDIAAKMNLDKQIFINLTEVNSKPELIVAIKMNELTLLDKILLKKNNLKDNRRQVEL